MKILRISIAVLMIIFYGYSAYMTKYNDNWGYVCAILFLVITIISVRYYSKYFSKPDDAENK